MFYTLYIFIFINFIFITSGDQLYSGHPRIIAINGNLIFYAGNNKNISFITTSSGYVNINNENLINLMKDARSASESIKILTNNVINPFISSNTRIKNLIEGPDGLLKRVTALENQNISITPGRILPINRVRQIATLQRRIRSLEIKVGNIYNLLTNNECATNPCKNGGECQDIFNGFICKCLDTWTGPTCESDVNECNKFSGTDLGCQNGATCINLPGSYQCVCGAGWFGIHCNRRTQDCNSGSPQELCGHGTCVSQNTGIGYKCICDQGWTSDGKTPACTVDVNECEASKPHCSMNPVVPCINVPGTYYCGNCPAGYSGNGYYCTDIDECLTLNGGCSLNPLVSCFNTMGSRMCGPCPSGYIGDGITCTYRGVCQINNGGCHTLARCIENPAIGDNYVQCICPNGYQGNGLGPNGCSRTDLSPIISSCSSNPCIHGTCISHSNNSFICTCNSGYTGTTCNIKIKACDSNPCTNGGTCTNTKTGYSCECTNKYTGINCEIETQACGGRLTGETGYLQYPSTNSTTYSHKLSCSWVIETTENKVLNISFTKFNIESSADCLYDWLQIHDGSNSAAHIIGRFCGSELPKGGFITSTHNSLYIWFRSDQTVASDGFAFKWTTVTPECGAAIISDTHGTLKSPGSPGNYPPNRDCRWLILAPYGKRIQFHFFTLMIGNNPNCSSDYLEIRSGMLESDQILAKFCNSSHPEPITTLGSTALVLFHSDATGSDAGFQISYSIVEGIPGCGGVFTTDPGEISSPMQNDQYPSNIRCDYKIKLIDQLKIKITFIKFSLEHSVSCKFDYIEIREGSNQNAPLVGRYCGTNIPPSYTSNSNELYIRFYSDSFINDEGFKLKYESVCGEVLEAPSGYFTSPGYPHTSNGLGSCIYLIKQKPGTAIKLTLFDIGVSSNTSVYYRCALNNLEVRDGDNQNSTLIDKFCKISDPVEIISTHNYLWLKYSTKSFLYRGFSANYSTIDIACGGIYKENLGIIKSPAHPDAYPPNIQCTWIISAPLGHSIQINWINFNVEKTVTCYVDYVAIYENNTVTGVNSKIGQYCGRNLPPTVTSTTNLLTVFFKTDSSLSGDGFIMSYIFIDDSKACGGNYFATTGKIQSPNYPESYPPDKDCTWVISVPHGQQIMLNIEDFYLEQYLNCHSDYLEIRNGAFENSPLIGKYCGNEIPKQIPSHTNNIYLKFHSDNALNRRGFKIFWDGTATGCGGTLSSPSGQISSPNYPQPYGSNAVCYWKISSSAGSILQLVFVDLHLEYHSSCRLDYVQVYDGLTILSKSLGKYCSDVSSHTITTTSNKALIKFRTDTSHEQRGFLLKYSTLCNNTVTGYNGVIESLNFPNKYPKNQDCTWTIEVPVGNKINISFSHFELENAAVHQKTCKFDYIEIKELDSLESEDVLLDKYCGNNLPDLIHSSKNIVKLHFVTDSIVSAAGFRLEWVVDGCSAFLTHPTGVIQTPGYPLAYPHDTVCEWKIQVDFNKSIELALNAFSFELTNDCVYDSLKVYNGPDENAPMLANICHSDKGLNITSTSNIMFVKFRSDVTYAGHGFQATYRTIPSQCGAKFTSLQGTIHSRNYPKNYKVKDDCEWLIEIHPNYVIELNFQDLDLIYSVNCTKDYLKIYDGANDSAPLLHTFCTNKKPNTTIISTTNTLYLRMSVSLPYTSKGFLANYTTGCGMRKIVTSTGLLDVADWGFWDCSWTLIADSPEKHISLTITHLDISTDCATPVLKIYDGEDDESPLIGSYCGRKAPPTIISKGSAIHIDLSYAYGAYITATYSVITSDCGGNLTSQQGYFSSPGYPNNYPLNTECQWYINVAPGNKIQLSFINFDIVTSDSCDSDYVEIREESPHGRLLGIFCGSEIPSNLTQSNNLWVQFKSTDIGTAAGFLAEYNLVYGNELFAQKGQIASPFYPKIYPASSIWNTDFTSWRITVDFQNVVLITFKDFESDGYTHECSSNGLIIFDGYDNTAPELARICSVDYSKPIRSTSNVVYIRYNSYRYTFKFLLEWQAIKPVVRNNTKNMIITDCGSDSIIDLSTIYNYTLQSPGFPNGYANNLNCEWIFSTTPENHLSISFSNMDLESFNTKCLLDSVSVYYGENGLPNWKLLDKFCLQNATYLRKMHTSNLLRVVFNTDAHINKTGFKAIIRQECGGSIFDSNGIIEITNTTLKREYTDSCEWNITVKAGRTIEITFLEFDMESKDGDDCKNYVLLKNGIYPNSPLLGKGKYCGNTKSQLNRTTGNTLYVKYVGNKLIKGFKFAFKEISIACGGHIKLDNLYNSTTISSPNYPNIPTPHTECIWIISGPSGEILQIDFIDRFDLTFSKNCTKAGVEIRDGGTTVSKLIDVFCSETPSTQKTSDNMVYIRFYTDVSDPKNGFRANVSIATCGGTIRGKQGTFTSPSYPGSISYPANTICTWKIVGPIDHYLNVSFNDFRFPNFRNCSNTNHLVIKEVPIFGNETIIGKFCGPRKPDDIRTSSNTVILQMKILNSQMVKGFSVTFNASQESCGGEINADSGIITSPGYPIAYYYNRNCVWSITVPKGRRVTVTLLDLDLDDSHFLYRQGLVFFNAKNYRSLIKYTYSHDKKQTIKSTDNQMMVYFWSTGTSTHRGFKLKFESTEPTICTGDFSKESGVIETPTANLTTYFCEWVRQDQSDNFNNKSLILTINAPYIGTKHSYACIHVGTNIVISTEDTDEVIAQLCGIYTEPQIVRTPYPFTKLMVTQGRYHKKMNFTILYKVNDCGGILTQSFGTISSPNFPNRSPDVIDCAWLIKLEEGQAIHVNFTTFDLDTSCTNDFVDIYNGATPLSPKIGRYCGKTSPSFIQSESNALWFNYHAAKNGNGKGFSFDYEPVVSGCGGIFHDNTRFIETPNYPNNYPNNAECSWEVRSVEGYHIGLVFTGRFHIEESPNCTNDFVEVWDYVDDTWQSLGRRCGRNQTTHFNSTTNRMRILFRSNSKLQASGFKALWTLNCGGVFRATNTPKYLTSPGYPRLYNSNLNCKYEIVAPGKYVNVVFEDFVLEEGSSSKCNYDNVTITRNRFTRQQWNSFHYPAKYNLMYMVLGIFCGTDKPQPIRADGLIIYFKTDSWVNRKGFKLRYFVDNCGGSVTSETQLQSPVDIRGKDKYYGVLNCLWNITAPLNKVVIVKFTFFEFEHNRNCNYDNVALYDGTQVIDSKRLALLCGYITSNLPMIRSTGNNLLIRMKTDHSNHFRGFKADVQFMYNENVGCGGTVNLTKQMTSKILRSPDINNTGKYEPFLDCHWLIVAPVDEVIELSFESFHLDKCFGMNNQTDNCTCDYIQVRDGGGPLSELVSQVCGHNLPITIVSSRNQLWIRMVTDGTSESTGFRAVVKRLPSLCGPSVLIATNEAKYLKSPNYPNNYPNNARCLWLIKSSSLLSKIEIHFDAFKLQKLEDENSCNTDVLKISDKLAYYSVAEGLGQNFVFTGPSVMATRLGSRYSLVSYTYCGVRQPPAFYSMRNEIMISFTSDSSITNSGFKLEYRILGNCRNFTNATQGRVVNEGISNNCTFKIIAPVNYTISIYFQQFLVTDYRLNCRQTSLDVYDGPPNNSTKLANLCGFQVPNPIFSKSNQLWFNVRTLRKAGIYDFTFTTTDKGRGCGGRLYNFVGKISSPMYPESYRNNTVCRWDITVPRGLQVHLHFVVFDLGLSSTCTTDFVEVIEVDTSNNNEIVRSVFCGGDNPAKIVSTTNSIAIRYTSTVNNAGSGWVATFVGKGSAL